MLKLAVEVFQDPGRPQGGHAVIRLKGIADVPDVITYRIKPVESAHPLDGRTTWPEGERRPIATRVTKDCVELVVGPELVENPLFLPGTLALIEIPQCAARGEVLWPRIAPLARPRRRHLVAARTQRPVASEQEAPDAGKGTGAPRPEAADQRSTEAVGADGLARAVVPPVAGSPIVAAGGPPLLPAADATVGPAPTAHAVAVSEPVAQGAATPGLQRPQQVRPSFSSGDAVGWVAVPLRRAWYRNPRRFAAVAATVVIVGLAVSSLLLRAVGHPEGPAVAHPAAMVPTPARAGPLSELVSVGTTSPRGMQTRDIDPLQLLERADALANGDEAAGDRQEAAWMLRRYLARTLAEERTLWALTQLGSMLAEPGNGRSPDYAQARQLWELAGNLGDPVAMCFLAALHENGLGVRQDRSMALDWYRRARPAGGCPGLDEAMARAGGK